MNVSDNYMWQIYTSVVRSKIQSFWKTVMRQKPVVSPDLKRFEVIKKCRTKFDCLVHEMLFIRALKPNINVQSDSTRAKVFL